MEEKTFVIFFADLVNSTNIADNLPPKVYVEDILYPYQELARNLATHVFKHWEGRPHIKEVRGDEVFIITSIDDSEDKQSFINDISTFFVLLRILWYLSKYNKDRINNFREPIDIGSGINLGKGVLDFIDEKPVFSGYEINKGKRVEGLSRKGNDLKIVLSHSAKRSFSSKDQCIIRYSSGIEGEGKGISNRFDVYEISEIYSSKVFDLMKSFLGEREFNTYISNWEDLADNLSNISPQFYWFSNMLGTYHLYKMQKSDNYLILKKAYEFYNNRSYLNKYFLSSFTKGMYYLENKEYEKSYIEFNESESIFSNLMTSNLKIDVMMELYKNNKIYSNFDFIIEIKKHIHLTLNKLTVDKFIKKLEKYEEILNT